MQDNRVSAQVRSGGRARFDTRTSSTPPQAVARPFAVTSSDGVRLAGIHLPGPARDATTALVVCHGFTHHTGHPISRGVLESLARSAPVVAVDMRGHGGSGGRNTVGDRELLDVDAAVGWARRAGYPRVATTGFSLGGAVVLRQAALGAARPDAVAAVSAPARWYSRETVAMRRVHWLLEQPHGRLVARLLGVRLDDPWATLPPSPVEVVAGIAPIPLLLVHFTDDRYFSPDHATALAAASGGHAALWSEPGGGHGESGTGPALADRLARWALAAAAPRAVGPPDDGDQRGSTVGRCGTVPDEGSEVG
jgi:uncharacterized protein